MWVGSTNTYNANLLWAACCLGFFGFLWVGEMTAPENGVFDPGAHLGFSDIAVDERESPTFIRVSIKQSKTNPFRRGVDLFLE